MKKKLLCAVCSCLICTMAAQGDAETKVPTYSQVWYELNSTNSIGRRTTVEIDLEANTGSDTNSFNFNPTEHFIQTGIMCWLHHYLSPRIKASVCLATWYNPEVPEAGQYSYTEIRAAYQLTHYLLLRKATIASRLRIEQRFLQQEGGDSYDYAPRLRFAPKMVYALNGNVIRARTIYAILRDEIYLVPGADRFLKQNRFTIGLGYSFTDDVVLELTYNNQAKFNANAAGEQTHTIGITLSVNNLFVKKEKAANP